MNITEITFECLWCKKNHTVTVSWYCHLFKCSCGNSIKIEPIKEEV